MGKAHRPPLESLACVNDGCQQYAQAGHGNLSVRKTYGKDELRYLRCRSCGREFSERRNTPLWNSKISEQKALAVAEQLAEGTSFKGTSRLVKVSPEAVRRLAGQLGEHGGRFHEAHVKYLSATALQADERWGFVGSKQQLWEAEVIDPKSRLIVERAQGERNEALLRRLLEGAQRRLCYPHGVVLLWCSSAMVNRATRRSFPRCSASLTALQEAGSGGVFQRCAIASPAPRRTSGSLSSALVSAW